MDRQALLVEANEEIDERIAQRTEADDQAFQKIDDSVRIFPKYERFGEMIFPKDGRFGEDPWAGGGDGPSE